MSRDDFVAWDINIFFSKDFFGSNPSSADNRALYSVPLVMNHPVTAADARIFRALKMIPFGFSNQINSFSSNLALIVKYDGNIFE